MQVLSNVQRPAAHNRAPKLYAACPAAQQIITDPDSSIGALLARRSNVDLKDKWRNMRPKSCKAGGAALKRVRPLLASSPLPFEEVQYMLHAVAACRSCGVSVIVSL